MSQKSMRKLRTRVKLWAKSASRPLWQAAQRYRWLKSQVHPDPDCPKINTKALKRRRKSIAAQKQAAAERRSRRI